jgi:hypothetical protein
VFHFEAEGKDKAGAVINYVVDGKIENLAMHNRTGDRHLEEPARVRRVQDHEAVGSRGDLDLVSRAARRALDRRGDAGGWPPPPRTTRSSRSSTTRSRRRSRAS